MARILGIDYGKRRIGLALSDPLELMAQPLATIDRHRGPGAITEIATLVREREVAAIVVGLPLEADGGEGEMAAAARRWGGHLADAVEVPVAFRDERFSSQWADRSLKEMGGARGDKGRRDALAAQAILEDYLLSRRTAV